MGKKAKVEQIVSGASLIPAGKLRCYVTGKYRLDTPEEHVYSISETETV